jgi:hypothetical protein
MAEAIPPTRKFGCGFLPPKIVWTRITGRQFVGRMTPVSVREDPELPGLDEAADPVLDLREVGGRVVGPGGDRTCDLRRARGIGGQRAHHVHPIQRVQVIEVDHVVLDELHPQDQVPDRVGVGRNANVQGVFHRPQRGDRVDDCAHATDALGEGPRIPRVAAFHDDLDPSELGRGRPGVGDTSFLGLDLDP